MAPFWRRSRRLLAGEWIVGAVILLALVTTRVHSYLLFHTIAEVFSVAVAFAIFAFFWNTRRFLNNGCYLVLAVGHLFAGMIDLLHAMAYEGMEIFEGHGANLPTQLWIAARFVQTAAFLLAPLFVRRRLASLPVMAGFAMVSGGLLLSIFGGAFPVCFVELGDDRGLTLFKIVSEYVICGLLILSVWLFVRQRQHFHPRVWQPLVASIVVTIAAEFMFTLYHSPQGLANLVGHVLKIVAFFLLYRAIIEVGLRQPYGLIFRELKQSEEALRRSDERFRTVADFTYDWEYWIDAQGKYIYVSPSCERITGYPAADFLARPELMEEIAWPEDREKVRAHYCEIRARSGPLKLEFRIVTRQGEVRWIEHVCQPVSGADGRQLGRRGNNRDVTDRMLAEQAVHRAQQELLEHQRREKQQVETELAKAKDALVRHTRLATLGQVAASIAHDLRNPLHALQMGIAILQRLVDPADAESQRYLRLMDDEIHTTNALISNLMEMARSKEAGKQNVELGPLVCEVLQRHGGDGHVVTKLDFQTEPFVVWADPIQLRQLLWNLIGNAVQAMEHRGRICVSAWRRGSWDVIRVTDTGPGVPAEFRESLFEPLVSGRLRGTGLGLAICRQIVQRHGGSVELLDSDTIGAVFEIRLPSPPAEVVEAVETLGSDLFTREATTATQNG